MDPTLISLDTMTTPEEARELMKRYCDRQILIFRRLWAQRDVIGEEYYVPSIKDAHAKLIGKLAVIHLRLIDSGHTKEAEEVWNIVKLIGKPNYEGITDPKLLSEIEASYRAFVGTTSSPEEDTEQEPA